VPAVAAPAPAFWARRLGVDNAAVDKELFKETRKKNCYNCFGRGWTV
jgi:hypothetical protein